MFLFATLRVLVYRQVDLSRTQTKTATQTGNRFSQPNSSCGK